MSSGLQLVVDVLAEIVAEPPAFVERVRTGAQSRLVAIEQSSCYRILLRLTGPTLGDVLPPTLRDHSDQANAFGFGVGHCAALELSGRNYSSFCSICADLLELRMEFLYIVHGYSMAVFLAFPDPQQERC